MGNLSCQFIFHLYRLSLANVNSAKITPFCYIQELRIIILNIFYTNSYFLSLYTILNEILVHLMNEKESIQLT